MTSLTSRSLPAPSSRSVEHGHGARADHRAGHRGGGHEQQRTAPRAERQRRSPPEPAPGQERPTARRRRVRRCGDAGRRGDRVPHPRRAGAPSAPGAASSGTASDVDGPLQGRHLGAAPLARLEVRGVVGGQGLAERGQCQLLRRAVLHRPPPAVVRRRSRVRRMWDLTVPSGSPVRVAIWAWVRSSKNASSMIPRWGWPRRSSSSSSRTRSATAVSTPGVRDGRTGRPAPPTSPPRSGGAACPGGPRCRRSCAGRRRRARPGADPSPAGSPRVRSRPRRTSAG